MPHRLFSFAALALLTTLAAAQDAAEPRDAIVSTDHKLTLAGQTIDYTAQAGTLPIKNDKGEVTARMFHVAYLRKGVTDVSKRPVLFAFNGGPGSSAVWLHLGIFGPRRVKHTTEGTLPKPPYELETNSDTLLDLADIVLIDPITTGFSRPAAGKDGKEFHSVEGDLRSVAEFIRLWLTRNKRWASPKFLAGESYGTTRAAGLSGTLQGQGINLNGVILISAVLNFQTILFDESNELPYVVYLPSYTAAAWYHKKLPADLQQKPLTEAIAESRQFVENEYLRILQRGLSLTDAERRDAAAKIARLTGLSEDYVRGANLRIDASRFRKELLRDRRLIIGRFDSRLTLPDTDTTRDTPAADPSYAAVLGLYTQAINQYLRGELKYEADLPYKLLTGDVQPWDFGPGARNRFLNVGPALQSALTQNPYLKVMLASGYYDLATPFYGADYTFDHLGSNPALKERLTTEYYEAGHMMYIHKPSREKLHRDLVKFIQGAM